MSDVDKISQLHLIITQINGLLLSVWVFRVVSLTCDGNNTFSLTHLLFRFLCLPVLLVITNTNTLMSHRELACVLLCDACL